MSSTDTETGDRGAVSSTRRLDRECGVFYRYLGAAAEPDPYVLEKYASAHRVVPLLRDATPAPFDRLLLGFARVHPRLARAADAHARIFRPQTLLRKKLTLLIAILESGPRTCAIVEAPDGAPETFGLRALGHVGISLVVLAAAALLLLPIQLALGAFSSARRGGGR